MNLYITSDKFKDQSSYLVAFLASVIGLGVFKEDLSHTHITVFGKHPTLLNLFAPLVIMLLVSVYLSALALLLDNFDITKLPIKGYVSFVANLTGAIALFAPVFFLAIWGVSAIDQALSSHRAFSQSIIKGLIATTAIIETLIALLATINSQKRLKSILASRAIEEDAKASRRHENLAKSLTEFVRKYEYVQNYMKKYLELLGYSVNNVSFHHMSKILADKGVFEKEDLSRSRSISTLRNEYIHKDTQPTQARLDKAFDDLEELHSAVSLGYLALSPTDKESGKRKSAD